MKIFYDYLVVLQVVLVLYYLKCTITLNKYILMLCLLIPLYLQKAIIFAINFIFMNGDKDFLSSISIEKENNTIGRVAYARRGR